jgi:hypothetical protein
MDLITIQQLLYILERTLYISDQWLKWPKVTAGAHVFIHLCLQISEDQKKVFYILKVNKNKKGRLLIPRI